MNPSTDVQKRQWTFFSTGDVQCARVRKPLQTRKALAAAGAQMQRARDHFADFLHSLAVIFCFPLGFKFCCMVLRVANARALIIDLRRLCYLQPVQWITTRADLDNCSVIRVSTTISCTLPFYFFLECYRWVMDFKATASRGVLIAQFEEYFDDALIMMQKKIMQYMQLKWKGRNSRLVLLAV